VIGVGPLPDAIAADPRAHTFAVAIHDPSRLVLVDSRTGRIRQRVEVPVGDGGAKASTPAVFLVPAETGKRAVAIAPATHTTPAQLPSQASVVLGRTFVADPHAARVDVLDRGRPVAHLADTARPGGLSPADFAGALAVVSTTDRTVALYDPRTLRRLASAPAGAGPTNVISEGERLYVADTRGDALLTFTTRPRLRRIATTPLPGGPYGLALDPVRRRLHVTLTRRNELVTLPTDGSATAPERRPTVRQPDAVAVDSATGTIAVAGRARGALQLITADPRGALPARHTGPPG
jgi:hypothetical protein